MAETVSDYVVQRLHDWGVSRVYGYPGDGINGLMGALQRSPEKLRFVQTRHEELAAFMACAHAKFSGQVGVCLATSGPGAIHLLNGLYDARMDHQPVVAIVGQQKRMALGGDYQQEVDLVSLFKDVASHYVHMVSTPVQARTLIDRAVRIAVAERTVTCVIIPADIQDEDAQPSPPRKHGAVLTSVGYSRPRIVPEMRDLERAARILNQAGKPAMLVGAGAFAAADEIMQTAELLGAGVAKALLGKTVVGDDLPYVTGAIGLLGTRPSWDLMMNCDALLIVGSSFPYSEFLPKEGQARAVQVDIKPRMLGLRYPTELNLHGDARLTLQALLPLLDEKDNTDWRRQITESVDEWWKVLEARAYIEADPINPQRVFWELSQRLPDDAIITADSGSAANWFARDLKVRRGMMASLSGNLATMCPGVPYATAAKFCHPGRPVIACVGDGAMQMLGNNGLISIAEYWKEWSDPRLIVCVLNNEDLNQVTWEQRVLSGDPRFAASQDVPAFNYATYAEQVGLRGIRIEDPDNVAPAWDEALTAREPTVLDFRTDPNVPPLPPHITFEQAMAYMSSMGRGDPDRLATIKLSFKELVQSWIPQPSGRA